MREYLASDVIAVAMPKEVFGKAVTYLNNQFEHLLVYFDNGLMPIDNNETERLMEQEALMSFGASKPATHLPAKL